jgi:hypothetical protein
MRKRFGSGFKWTIVIAVWLTGVLLGLLAIQQQSSTPSAKARAPSQWPSGGRIQRDLDRPTLVLFAHPYCPCTRASLAELSRLMTTLSGRLGLRVLFSRPEGVEGDGESSGLVERARHIPGAVVDVDVGGREAASFGAYTSGEAFLFGADGGLLFHGGITAARGHEGDNVGSRSIISLLTTGSTDLAQSAVFGCEL